MRILYAGVAACALMLAPAANAIDFSDVHVDTSISNDDWTCCDLTGGTGHFGGLSIYDATRDGGSPQMSDTQYETKELAKAAVTVTMAVPGALIGGPAGAFAAFLGGYFGPLLHDELMNLVDDPLGPAYTVETAAQRDRRHAIADMVETMLGGPANNIEWDERPYFGSHTYNKNVNGVTVGSSNVRDLGRRTRNGGTLSKAERALVTGWTPLQRKVAGLFLNTSAANIVNTSGITAKPLSDVAGGGILNISKYLTPADDQCTALGLVLYTMRPSDRGNMISIVAGSTVINNSRRIKINDGFVKCLKIYKNQLVWATKLQ